MRKFKILNTEGTRDFAFSLIGMIFEGKEVQENDREYIQLDTCDGELLFLNEEVQEIF